MILNEKVVIVSGASRRLGRCYAMALGKAGATVIALARTLGEDTAQPGSLLEVEASGRAAGYDIHAYRCDLTDEENIRAVVAAVAERFGGIDGIVNNAVDMSGSDDSLDISADAWNRAMQVNVRAPYLLIAQSHLHMVARGGGAIVNVTSLVAGPTGKGGGAHKGLALYGAAKAALNRLTTWFAAEFESDNIAVNAISPGDVSVYMRSVNGVDLKARGQEVVEGNQLDERFWGDPVVHLIAARPPEPTGQILHTYTYGETWGARHATPPDWSPEVLHLLGRDNLAASDANA
jgi:NAD(P)-dependent dehydrogenase (short-subunit alcohol dehydrogenase family)